MWRLASRRSSTTRGVERRGPLAQKHQRGLYGRVADTGALIEGAAPRPAYVHHKPYYAQTIAKFNDLVRDYALAGVVATPASVRAQTRASTRSSCVASRRAATSRTPQVQVRTMQISLHAYSKVVQKRFCDTVAAVIINELVAGHGGTITDSAHKWAAVLADKQEDPASRAVRRFCVSIGCTRRRRSFSNCERPAKP